MIDFDRVLIAGVGLIGGSWALALRRAGYSRPVLGFDPAPQARAALVCGALDGLAPRGLAVPEDVAAGDLVVLAMPVAAMVGFLAHSGRELPPGVVVTDVGSTKRAVTAAWVTRGNDSTGPAFVGGHPMAGTERAGFSAASADLFDAAPYFLVSPPGAALDRVAAAVRMLGADPIVVDAETHDRAVALTSHVPQLVSSTLAALVASRAPALPAGPGLATMTRLAASPWSVWADVLETNADRVAPALDELIGALEAVRQAVSSGNLEPVAQMFDEAVDACRVPGWRA